MENGSSLIAASFLLEHKSGYIENAFEGKTKNGKIYKIALCWGHSGLGLNKIINKHIIYLNDFNSIPEALSTISNVLTNGKWKNSKDNKIRIENGKFVVILKNSEEGTFVISVYDNSRKPKNKIR